MKQNEKINNSKIKVVTENRAKRIRRWTKKRKVRRIEWERAGKREEAWSIVHFTKSLRRVSSVNKWINLSVSLQSMTPSLCSPQTSRASNPLSHAHKSNSKQGLCTNIPNRSVGTEYLSYNCTRCEGSNPQCNDFLY